jgi:hypothetical protein
MLSTSQEVAARNLFKVKVTKKASSIVTIRYSKVQPTNQGNYHRVKCFAQKRNMSQKSMNNSTISRNTTHSKLPLFCRQAKHETDEPREIKARAIKMLMKASINSGTPQLGSVEKKTL